MFSEDFKIRKDRIGVLIGEKGSVKKLVEKLCEVKLTITDQDVLIEGEGLGLLRAKNFVNAVNRGFSPDNANSLLNSDDYGILVFNLTEYIASDNKDGLSRLKGRVIGRDGSVRKRLENITNTLISVQGKTVSVIGRVEDLGLVRKGISMLLEGNQHSRVFAQIYNLKKREEIDKQINPYLKD